MGGSRDSDSAKEVVPQSDAAPAIQAEAIAAANANEPLLEPPQIRTPTINTPTAEEQSHGGDIAMESPSPSTVSHAETFLTNSSLDQDGVPPPAYGGSHDQFQISQGGLNTSARLLEDGRINIDIKEDSRLTSSLLVPALKRSFSYRATEEPSELPPGYIPPSLGGVASGPPPPPMNVVIHVVGSRGDVQPFVALGKVLRETYGHRVRLATHPVFKDFVTENGLEFFSIGGDPAELMAFMVKHPGLMPGTEALKNGDIRRRRKGMYEIVQGCWRSCYEAGDGIGVASSAANAGENFEGRPFVADAIIANPPSFAHLHIAEKMGIPLHLMFTMPWSPTQAFPHPLANIQNSTTDTSITNFLSYVLVELMTWQGLGDVINRFREKHLGLEPLGVMWAPGLAARLRIPYTYCWSPALIPKPKDWGNHISISGFYFLSLASNYQPAPDLQAFLDAGPPPVYIGFGSIVVEDPNAMTQLIFDAVKLSGQRALVSKGWGGFGSEDLNVPENIFMLGNVPHDWLFKRVSCVVHHGGAGTTAAGIATGRPTVVVPFFGDQPFWGAMVARAGAGPDPIPSKKLTAENLAQGIKEALSDSSIQKAKELGESIAHEKGCDVGGKAFHDALDMDQMRCSLAPSRVAVWKVRRTNVKLSALAASVLGQQGKLDFADLRLHRPKECPAEDTPFEPIGGGATALMNTAGTMAMGIADIPMDLFKTVQKRSANKQKAEERDSSPNADAGEGSSQDQTLETPSRDGRSPSFSTMSSSSLTTDGHSGSATLSPGHPESASQAGRRSSSGGKSPTGRKSPSPVPGMDVEKAVDATRGIARFTEAGLKSPMDFTLALAKGFRNAPRLYGDDTVRPASRVTGISSGLRTAGKEFGYGMYDGISGLVTQPMEGVKKEGAAGFFKGFGKGLGGVFFKSGAASWGLLGYTFQGIYKELKKSSGASLQNYIIAARTAQGFEEWSHATPEECRDIVARWDAMQGDIQKQKKRRHDSYTKPFSRKTEKAPLDQNASTASPAAATFSPAERSATVPSAASSSSPQPWTQSQPGMPSGEQSEYEEAIRQSVAQTSTGNPDEDAEVERAIRASLTELQNQPKQTDDEQALAQAIRESLHQAHGTAPTGQTDTAPSASQDLSIGDDDEELRQAIEASKREHEEHERSKAEEDAVVEYLKKQTLAEGLD